METLERLRNSAALSLPPVSTRDAQKWTSSSSSTRCSNRDAQLHFRSTQHPVDRSLLSTRSVHRGKKWPEGIMKGVGCGSSQGKAPCFANHPVLKHIKSLMEIYRCPMPVWKQEVCPSTVRSVQVHFEFSQNVRIRNTVTFSLPMAARSSAS